MKDAFYNVGDQNIGSSKFMPLEQLSEFMGRSSYSCLTASKEYDQIIETTRPQDIAKGNASDVETGSSYKNRTFIWNYGNRLEALKTQLDRGYNPEDIEEALNILNPKIEAKKDFYLKSQVKSLKASIRGKKQAQEYADKLVDSDEFKRYVFSTDIGNIVDGIGVVEGERKAIPHFNYLGNRLKAYRLKLELENINPDSYEAKTAHSRLSRAIEAKGDKRFKRELEDIVENYKPVKTAEIIDITQACASDSLTACGALAGCYNPQDVLPIVGLIKKYKKAPNDRILELFEEYYAGKSVSKKGAITYSEKNQVTADDIKKIRAIFGPIQKLAGKYKSGADDFILDMLTGGGYADILKDITGLTVDDVHKIRNLKKGKGLAYKLMAGAGGLILISGVGGFEIREYVLGKQAESLKASAAFSQQEGRYREALDQAKEAQNKYKRTLFSKNNKSAAGLINFIEENISLVNQAETLINEAKKLQGEGNYEEALERLNRAKAAYLLDTSKNNDAAVDSSITQLQTDIKLQKETEKGKQNEAALTKLYSGIQNKDLEAIAAGLAALDSLRKTYNTGEFEGTASYSGDESAYKNVEKLIEDTLASTRNTLNDLLAHKDNFTLKNLSGLDAYVQDLENLRADINLSNLLGVDMLPEYEQALHQAFNTRRDIYSLESFLHLTKTVGQKQDGVNKFAKEAKESLRKAGFSEDVYSQKEFKETLKKLGEKNSLGRFKRSIDRHVKGQDYYFGWDILSQLNEFLKTSKEKLGSDTEGYRMIRDASLDYISGTLENYKQASLLRKIWREFKVWEAIPGVAAITNPNAEGTILEGIRHIFIPAEFRDNPTKIVNGEGELKSGDKTSASMDILHTSKEIWKLYYAASAIDKATRGGAQAKSEEGGLGGGQTGGGGTDGGQTQPTIGGGQI